MNDLLRDYIFTHLLCNETTNKNITPYGVVVLECHGGPVTLQPHLETRQPNVDSKSKHRSGVIS